jgi:uncharacterized Fe-S cluster protein YjdI
VLAWTEVLRGHSSSDDEAKRDTVEYRNIENIDGNNAHSGATVLGQGSVFRMESDVWFRDTLSTSAGHETTTKVLARVSSQ